MSLLEISHLRKSFGECLAVDDVSFHVDAGEVFGLLGPNGAGKSTTMMMIAGLVAPDAGRDGKGVRNRLLTGAGGTGRSMQKNGS